jgi:hypothetical protein
MVCENTNRGTVWNQFVDTLVWHEISSSQSSCVFGASLHSVDSICFFLFPSFCVCSIIV